MRDRIGRCTRAICRPLRWAVRHQLPTRYTLIVLGTAAAIIVVRQLGAPRRYTFGYPDEVDLAVVILLYLLAATHTTIAAVMWFQRRTWHPSNAAMFQFIGVKAVFWTSLATGYVFRGIGVNIETLILFVMMALTTIELDARLINRYLLGSEDPSVGKEM
jgi:4-amino-4-deoxy-L-arabinose transferase-like glycosyltransferase